MATKSFHPLIGSLCLSIFAGLLSCNAPALAERASLVADLDSGIVLHAKNSRLTSFPASLTKLMTLYLLFEALESNRLGMQEKLSISDRAAGQQPIKLGLKSGGTITVEQVLLALIVRSANDAAVVAAEALADSEAAFAEKMNIKAKQLGMIDSLFRNASGLPNAEQVTSARDMALLAKALQEDFPQYFPLFSRRSFQYQGRTISTHNHFLTGYQGAKGMKTGFTCNAGYNLVSAVERDGKRLIGVVLGESNAGRRTVQMTKLFDAALAKKTGEKTPLTLGSLLNASGQGANELPNSKAIADTCTGKGGTGLGKVSGWSLNVGTGKRVRQARALAAKNIRKYRRQLKGGRPVAIPTTHGKLTYQAAVTGLKRDNAIATCRHMRQKDRFCIVMPPAVGRTNMERGRVALKRSRNR